MRERENKVRQFEPGISGFLDPKYDRYILGVAYRSCQVPLPVYSHNAAVADVRQRGVGPLAAQRFIGKMEHNAVRPSPIVLHTFTPAATGELIRRLDLVTWDSVLGRAVIGICSRAGYPMAVGYSYSAIVRELDASQVPSDDLGELVSSAEYLETRMLPVDMGPSTPYIIRRVV